MGNKDEEWINKELEFFIYLIAVVAIIGSIIFVAIDGNKEYKNKEFDIISLERDAKLEGAFVLGSGYVDTTEYYYFYTKTEKGYKIEKLCATSVYLIETNDIEPSVYKIKEKGEQSYKVIYVPKGTIIREFKV